MKVLAIIAAAGGLGLIMSCGGLMLREAGIGGAVAVVWAGAVVMLAALIAVVALGSLYLYFAGDL